MATLEQFSRKQKNRQKIFLYAEGNFTDWWADGIGSTPHPVKLYLDAERKYSLCEKMDPEGTRGSAELKEKAREELMMCGRAYLGLFLQRF